MNKKTLRTLCRIFIGAILVFIIVSATLLVSR